MLRTNRPQRPVASVQAAPLTATRARGLAQVYAFSLLDSAIQRSERADPVMRELVASESERAQVLREVEMIVAALRMTALRTLAGE